ncbi:hypothetical protein DMC64_20390 [Amycolatopsis sp. WAC 04197]|uniref:hypothetical protein n=1 Tax=Amycolatopsis sp. WAC 04197 TaxID=2203199 RepID=UPI000F7A9788|nr:hypothetical protein [Amycolatopsis sp. WAC 04197]RSN45198.1 hypothetical protein DMC64_20390 [Amycolatopsis sp. WAC 04197]
MDRTLATRLADRALTTPPYADDLRCVWRALSVLLIARALPAVDAHYERLVKTTRDGSCHESVVAADPFPDRSADRRPRPGRMTSVD